MYTISLNIAKSNYLLLDSLKAAMGKFKDIEVLGEYSSYQEAARGLSNQIPDVLLLHMQIDPDFEGSLNEDSGLELLDYIIKKEIRTRVLIISNTTSVSIIDLVQKYKVAAFIRTNVSVNVLKIAINEVASGRTFFPQEIKTLIQARHHDMNLDTPISLSSREKEILQLISTGYSTPAIARELQLHKDTISDHRDSLMKKFQAKNAPDLIRLAYQWRLLQ